MKNKEVRNLLLCLIIFLLIIILVKKLLPTRELFTDGNESSEYPKNNENKYDVNSIDAYLIINLDKEKKRYASVINNLVDTGVKEDKIHRIDAVYERWNGHLGCGKSHIKALEYAINKNYKTVAILEDDFNFIEDKKRVNDSIDSFLSNFKDWSVIDLYYVTPNLEKTKIESVSRNKSSTTTCGLFVKNNFFKELLQNRKEAVAKMQEYTDNHLMKCKDNNNCKRIQIQSHIAIDQYHNKLQKTSNWYAFTPVIAKPSGDPSTIMRESFNSIEGFENKINNNIEYSNKLSEQDIQNLKKGQKIMTDMFRVFNQICRENNLKYWCIGGTFIGVIRHKGWIPWDGDIDIAMIEDDYKKLKEITKNNNKFNKLYFLQDADTDIHYKNSGKSYPKIRHKYSCYKKCQDGTRFHNGFMIDIFPYKLENNILKSYTNWDDYINYKYDDIFPLKEMLFEDIMVYMPKSYKEISKKTYQEFPPPLPDKDKRYPHEGQLIPNEICNFHYDKYPYMYISDDNINYKKIPSLKENYTNKHFLAFHTVFIPAENVKWLEEFLIYNINIGITQFYLYDNTGTKGRNGSQKNKNKYGFRFDEDSNDNNKLLNKIINKYKKYITYIKWQPRDKNGDIEYGWIKSAEHLVNNFGKYIKWCAFMDLDEFLFSKNNINILEYLKKNKDIGKITIKQKKFVDRFLIKNNLVTQDFRCIENINTNGWGIKHIVKISDIVKIGDMHNIDTKSKTININENILRFNHYNVNKKQLDWMKGFYKINKEFTLNGYDDSMKRYAYLFNNLNFLESFQNNENTQNKKIALCFLIYDKINHEKLWYDWLSNVDPNKYTIYIHYKENKPLKYFEKYKLEHSLKTCWGCLSVVNAQLYILENALKDLQNQHFIWLSGSCIPFKSFDFIYNFLKINKSYYNKAPDSQVFPRSNNALKYIKKENLKKANMASIINRKHAQIFVYNKQNINKWFNNINNVDEIALISIIYNNNLENELVLTDNIAAGSIIFAQWSDMSNYKIFEGSKKKNAYTYNYICKEELEYLINSKSLFGRKFEENCGGLENLLDLIK